MAAPSPPHPMSIAELHLAIADADADIDIEAAALERGGMICLEARGRISACRQERQRQEARLDQMQDAIDAELISAAKSGDVHGARRCIDCGADMDRPTSFPLEGQDAGGSPPPPGLVAPSVGNEGWTAVMYAAEHGHATVVKLLLDRGGDPDAACTSDRVPRQHTNPNRMVRAHGRGAGRAPRGQ